MFVEVVNICVDKSLCQNIPNLDCINIIMRASLVQILFKDNKVVVG